jgi:hypothetical protein
VLRPLPSNCPPVSLGPVVNLDYQEAPAFERKTRNGRLTHSSKGRSSQFQEAERGSIATKDGLTSRAIAASGRPSSEVSAQKLEALKRRFDAITAFKSWIPSERSLRFKGSDAALVQSRVCLTAPIFTSARACGYQALARSAGYGVSANVPQGPQVHQSCIRTDLSTVGARPLAGVVAEIGRRRTAMQLSTFPSKHRLFCRHSRQNDPFCS